MGRISDMVASLERDLEGAQQALENWCQTTVAKERQKAAAVTERLARMQAVTTELHDAVVEATEAVSPERSERLARALEQARGMIYRPHEGDPEG